MSETRPVFLFGTLLDPELRRIVFGEEVAVRSARLLGERAYDVSGGAYPILAEGDAADGLIAELGPRALDRGDWYEGLFGYTREAVLVETADGAETVDLWRYKGSIAHDGSPWALKSWQARFGTITRATAQDVMALRGLRADDEIARRWKQIQARTQARLNAEAQPAPATLRRGAALGDTQVHAKRVPYASFFSVEEYDLQHRLFSGGQSSELTRATFISADAVTVLPYDPRRDRVLLIEQFRPGPLARGDRNPWSLEAIAGRIDGGETPEATALREAREEANLTIDKLIAIGGHYPSPGAKAEYLYSFIGIADLPDDAGGIGGLDIENEDIRSHVIPYARLAGLIDTGEINNGPLIVSAHALERRRAALRHEA